MFYQGGRFLILLKLINIINQRRKYQQESEGGYTPWKLNQSLEDENITKSNECTIEKCFQTADFLS